MKNSIMLSDKGREIRTYVNTDRTSTYKWNLFVEKMYRLEDTFHRREEEVRFYKRIIN